MSGHRQVVAVHMACYRCLSGRADRHVGPNTAEADGTLDAESVPHWVGGFVETATVGIAIADLFDAADVAVAKLRQKGACLANAVRADALVRGADQRAAHRIDFGYAIDVPGTGGAGDRLAARGVARADNGDASVGHAVYGAGRVELRALVALVVAAGAALVDIAVAVVIDVVAADFVSGELVGLAYQELTIGAAQRSEAAVTQEICVTAFALSLAVISPFTVTPCLPASASSRSPGGTPTHRIDARHADASGATGATDSTGANDSTGARDLSLFLVGQVDTEEHLTPAEGDERPAPHEPAPSTHYAPPIHADEVTTRRGGAPSGPPTCAFGPPCRHKVVAELGRERLAPPVGDTRHERTCRFDTGPGRACRSRHVRCRWGSGRR